ncbi:2-dehydropantoate 2-reductase [Alteromonas sp. a30]|uniref:2-dehydropantoate 2-reductase n=1 Tax=Alteromonas sp. a30 TaxID=2730917 RepID=UPI00228069C0|nr:2-dehydropantoate 2-reductase [Alteromonas sp. a30]MCY7296153.1 2-dehydropantoate 2-reductase [Alteromonas sp. a30]
MKIVVYGAGSIGCYLGAVLLSQGMDVVLLGRERLKKVIQQREGIRLTDYQERDDFVANIAYSTDPTTLSQADVVLVTLKCTAMEQAAEALSNYVQDGCLIVCLQNGIGAELPVKQAVQQAEVVCGIVPFNVVQGEQAHFHRATEGSVYLPQHRSLHPIQDAFSHYGLACELRSDMKAVIWGKLMLNLNNAINALSDLPLKQELSQRGYRKVLAKCQQELLQVCQRKGIELAQLTSVKPHWLPRILLLPDWLFQILAQKMLAIDPQARSSMWEDIQAGRETEIQFLNGAVSSIAEEVGLSAPVNKVVAQQLRLLSENSISAPISARALLSQLSQV